MPKTIFGEAHKVAVAIIVAARKAQCISQVELGERLGKTQKYVSNIEVGKRRIDLIEFCAIARGIDMTPEALFAKIAESLPAELEI